MNTPYELGYLAYEEGIRTNPYDTADPRYIQWATGWSHAASNDLEPLEADCWNGEQEYPQ